MLCWAFLPPFLPPPQVNSLLAFSIGAAACWEPNALAALPLAGGGQQRGETCNQGPCQGLGGSPLALKSLGPEHHLQKQGLQGLFEHWLPAFLAKGVVVEECWQQC